MTNLSNQHAAMLLKALAESINSLRDLSWHLRRRPEVKRCTKDINIALRHGFETFYESVDLGVTTFLHNGRSISWALVISLEGAGWVIYYDVSKDGEYGADIFLSFPDKHSATLEELVRDLKDVIAELAEHALNFDFSLVDENW